MGNLVDLRINGNAGSNATLRQTSSGTPVANVRICVNYPNNQGSSEPIWYNLTFWNKLAERAAATIKKGWNVNANANRIRIREWVGQDQQKRQEMEVWVTEFDTYPPVQTGATVTKQPEGQTDIGTIILNTINALKAKLEPAVLPQQPAKTINEEIQDKLNKIIQSFGTGEKTTNKPNSTKTTGEQNVAEAIAALERSIDATQGLSGNPFEA